jgi:ornithine cyclodeaminase/alanine dehydrogenase-like protein (mu-crystallin family)
LDNQPPYIGRRELAALMDPEAHFEAAIAAFHAHADGRTTVPMPLHIAVEDGGFHAKAARVDRYVAVKVNSNFPGNPARGLPTIQGAVLLYDAGDGRLLAMLDSIEITSRRTAAASAVAVRHLARADASSVLICGCGGQGRAQLEAIARVARLERVFAWDADHAKAEAFSREMSRALGVEVSPTDQLRDADIVVTVTTATMPFLSRVAPGTFVAAVGADNPHKSEIHPDLMRASKVVTDSTAQAEAMGDLHHAPGAAVHAELGEIVAGRKPGRTDAGEVIVFDSTGVAIQDVAAAAWAYERHVAAREIGNA